MAEVENHFTVFVRLPFNRGDFVDPAPVSWSANKERALWDIISRQSKGNDIDWNALADKFEVTQPFLLQQAAWLYERQLSQVRAQMRKVVTTRPSATPSPQPGSVSGSMTGAHAMRRGGSGGSRVPSRLSTHTRDSPVARSNDSAPGTPVKASGVLRGATGLKSSRARTASSADQEVSDAMSRKSTRDADPNSQRQSSKRTSLQQQATKDPIMEQESPESEASEESLAAPTLGGRRLNPSSNRHRPNPGRKPYGSRETQGSDGDDLEDEDEDNDSPPFLPFASTTTKTVSDQSVPKADPSATLRGGFGSPSHPQRPTSHRRGTIERVPSAASRPQPQTQALTSSASSASSGPTPTTATHRQQNSFVATAQVVQARPPGPLSPRQQAALEAAGLSPRRRAGTHGKDGSDGTPSMGSSFSDLDDASVTQSALEEALMSNMGNNGGGNASVASRVSGISQALRSRYFDAQSRPTN